MSILSSSSHHLAQLLLVVILLCSTAGTLALPTADFFKERHGSTGPTSHWPIFEEFASSSSRNQDESKGILAGDSEPSDLQTGEDFGGGTYNAKKAWKVIDRSRQVTASEVDRKCHYHLILPIGSAPERRLWARTGRGQPKSCKAGKGVPV